MSRRVTRHELKLNSSAEVEVGGEHRVVHAGTWGLPTSRTPHIWIEHEDGPPVARCTYTLVCDGQPIKPGYTHTASFVTGNGMHAWHVYESYEALAARAA